MLSLVVTVAAVRAKAGLTDASYDAAIAALIAEQVPALLATLAPVSSPDADLGATEVVTAELLDGIDRAEGGVVLDGLRSEIPSTDGLRARGLARLAPYRLDGGKVRAAGPRVAPS